MPVPHCSLTCEELSSKQGLACSGVIPSTGVSRCEGPNDGLRYSRRADGDNRAMQLTGRVPHFSRVLCARSGRTFTKPSLLESLG
jgi:hypothetical protein